MKKAQIFINAVLGFALVLFIIPEVGAQWEEMEVVKYNFDIDTTPRYQQYPVVKHNPTNDEFMVLYSVTGPLRDDCNPGDEYECTTDFMSIGGRRVSPDGEILGGSIQLSPPEPGGKQAPSFVHNIFTNEYMLAFPIAPTKNMVDNQLYIARIDPAGNFQYGPELLYGVGRGFAFLPEVVFNPVRREYLVVYNEYDIFNSYLNNVGFILDENGNPIHGPFPVGNQVGDFYASRGAYNPTNDTYLVVWEDFRHAVNWMDVICEVYGALLDADGNMIVEIPIIDDYGLPNEADQRVPRPAYNPDRNEFLVVWRDHRTTLDDGGIIGRIIGPDGTPKGPDFVAADPPRIQSSPEPIYVEEEKKYFMTWHDAQNDTSPPGTPWWFSDKLDIYGRWLDETGSPIGDDIPLCIEQGWQISATMAYNPARKRFLITWYDRNAMGDYEPAVPPAQVPFATAPSEIRGTIYGIPPDTAISIGDQWANCGDVGVKIPICLINLEVEVGAVQVDLCENVDDCLICVGCEMTERTTIFDCMVNELENGCCAVVVFSKNPGGVINPGECDIVIIDYTLKDDPQCCSSCIKIDGVNLEVVDQYGYIVDSIVRDTGMICPFECGDVEPAASTAASWECGDGDIDIFDILEEVDFIIHVKDPDDCQAVRADVPTGTPPNCDPPDGVIDVGDLMVIIDMALNRQDCCSYYYGGVIY